MGLLAAAALGAAALGAVALGAVTLGAVTLGAAPASTAAPSPDAPQIKRRLDEVLATPEFSTHREGHEYRYRGEPLWGDSPDEPEDDATPESEREPGSSSLLELIATILARGVEAVLWAALVVGVILLVVYRRRLLDLIPSARSAARPANAPEILVGLGAVGPSLPDDPGAAAWALWQAGDGRGCVSLLYRGSLATLVERFGLDLPASATERDCVQRVRRHAAPPMSAYFHELTTVWQGVAYAGREPGENRIRALCEGWRDLFGAEP